MRWPKFWDLSRVWTNFFWEKFNMLQQSNRHSLWPLCLIFWESCGLLPVKTTSHNDPSLSEELNDHPFLWDLVLSVIHGQKIWANWSSIRSDCRVKNLIQIIDTCHISVHPGGHMQVCGSYKDSCPLHERPASSSNANAHSFISLPCFCHHMPSCSFLLDYLESRRRTHHLASLGSLSIAVCSWHHSRHACLCPDSSQWNSKCWSSDLETASCRWLLIAWSEMVISLARHNLLCHLELQKQPSSSLGWELQVSCLPPPSFLWKSPSVLGKCNCNLVQCKLTLGRRPDCGIPSLCHLDFLPLLVTQCSECSWIWTIFFLYTHTWLHKSCMWTSVLHCNAFSLREWSWEWHLFWNHGMTNSWIMPLQTAGPLVNSPARPTKRCLTLKTELEYTL